MSTATKCQGLFGRLFGHDFQARYSYTPGTFKADWGIFSSDVADIVRASRSRAYHGDVCRRCGSRLDKAAPK